MTSLSTVVRNLVKGCPIRSLVVVIVLATEIIINYNIFHKYPIEERCSAKYPEWSVLLDHPVSMSGGGVLGGSGEMYSAGQWWVEDDVVRGCPCSGLKPCVRKCCAIDEAFNSTDQCVDKNSNYQFTDRLTMFRQSQSDPVNVSRDHFSVISSVCDNPVEVSSLAYSSLVLRENGKIVNSSSRNTIRAGPGREAMFCLEVREASRGAEEEVVVVKCSATNYKRGMKSELYLQKYVVTRSLFVVVNCVTLGVYALLPQLRKGFGKALMCFVACRTVFVINGIVRHTTNPLRMGDQCIPTGYISIYFLHASMAWQLVVSYQIWDTFRVSSSSVGATSGNLDSRRFLVYSLIAWGVPFLIFCLDVVLAVTPAIPDIIQMTFDPKSCQWNNDFAKWIFVRSFYLSGQVANVVLVMSTLWRIRAFQQKSETLRGLNVQRPSPKDIQWSNLYMKVCLGMGTYYILVSSVAMLRWTFGIPDFYFETNKFVHDARAIEVFLLFVCKKENLAQLVHRLPSSTVVSSPTRFSRDSHRHQT